jgi:hypothetical protein
MEIFLSCCLTSGSACNEAVEKESAKGFLNYSSLIIISEKPQSKILKYNEKWISNKFMHALNGNVEFSEKDY